MKLLLELPDNQDSQEILNELRVQNLVDDLRSEQRFGGDPALIVAVSGGVSAILATISHIAHSWKRDVVLDVRAETCVISAQMDSRGGRLIIISDKAEPDVLTDERLENAQLPDRIIRSLGTN